MTRALQSRSVASQWVAARSKGWRMAPRDDVGTVFHVDGSQPRGLILVLALLTFWASSIVFSPKADAVLWLGLDFSYDKGTAKCIAVYNCSPDPTLTLRYTNGSATYAETWTSSSGNSDGSSRTGDESDPIFGKKGKNPCLKNVGWIPDTSGFNAKHGNSFSNAYTTRQFAHYNEGDVIFGWVHFIYQGSFDWTDGANCGDDDSSFDRTELFVHSEMTTSHGQNMNLEHKNWVTYSPDYDYASNGCVKLDYAQIVTEGSGVDTDSLEWLWINRTEQTDLTVSVIHGW